MSHVAIVNPWELPAPMTVKFDYDPSAPATLTSPADQSRVSIFACIVGGVNIVDMLSNKQHERLEGVILQEIEG